MQQQELKKKCASKIIKHLRGYLQLLPDKLKNPVSLDHAIICTPEALSDICAVLILISVSLKSGAIIECGLSLMNLMMNDLSSMVDVHLIDATIRIQSQGE